MVTDVAVTRAANTVTVLGGPTALIHLAGWTLLTDPTFDAAGTQYQDGPVLVRKTADPALKPAQLPSLDAVVVSHFVAINAAIGLATSDDRLVIRSLDNCSVTVLEVRRGRLRLIEGGHEADTLIR